MTWASNLIRRFTGNKTEGRYKVGPSPWLVPQLKSIEVNPHTAMTYNPVYAAIAAISGDIAILPFLTYERSKSGGKVEAFWHPAYDILDVEANEEISALNWERTILVHALSTGNGYSEIVRSGDGEPLSLHLLDPEKTEPQRAKSGRLFYLNEDRKILPENVIHISSLGYDGLKGYSPIKLGSRSLQLGMSAENFGAKFYQNSAVPSGYLKSVKAVDDIARDNLRKSFAAKNQGEENAFNVILLEEGMDFVASTIPPETAQFLETRSFGVIEVCRWFNINPIRLQVYDNSTYSNVEQAAIDYVNITLAPWIEQIESEVNRKLFTKLERRSLYAKHDLTARLRGDSASRSDFYTKMFMVGGYTQNDILRAEDKATIGPLGDKHYVPANMMAVEDQVVTEPVTTPVPEAKTLPEPVNDDRGQGITEAVRGVLVDALDRMTKVETKAIRRKLGKSDFAEAVTDFYTKHRSTLAGAIKPALTAYGVSRGMDYKPDDIAERIAHEATLELLAVVQTSRDLSNDVERVLSRWENEKVDAIMEAIQ